MLEQHPMHSQNRPQSAMDTSSYYVNPHSVRRMPTPNGPMTTSVKSVFDCELGCFSEDCEGEAGHGVPRGHCGQSSGHSGHQHTAGVHGLNGNHEVSPAKSETTPLGGANSHSSPTSQTSEPKDV